MIRLRPSDVVAYRVAEVFTEGLLYLMVVFSPWAFGTTQPWSVGTMNAGGYALGLLLALKLWIRWAKGYPAPRWEGTGAKAESRKQKSEGQDPKSEVRSPKSEVKEAKGERLAENSDRTLWDRIATAITGDSARKMATRLLAALTVAILGYCFVSALNARATFLPDQLRFDYHDCLRWLPHSLDSVSSWRALWNYLALACAFWAVRDWLLGKTDWEERAERNAGRETVTPSPLHPTLPLTLPSPPVGERVPNGRVRGPALDLGLGTSNSTCRHLLPARLRQLLFVLCLNGGLLGAECIVQRVSGTGKLLWLVEPEIHKTAEGQLGPYAYRSNGAQYLNLVWPVCLGFWWTLQRGRGASNRARRAGSAEQESEDRGQKSGSSSHRGETRSRIASDFGVRTGAKSSSRARSRAHHWLLPCGIVMAAAAIVSTSRGGALVAVGILALAALFLGVTHFWFHPWRSAAAERDGRRPNGVSADPAPAEAIESQSATVPAAVAWNEGRAKPPAGRPEPPQGACPPAGQRGGKTLRGQPANVAAAGTAALRLHRYASASLAGATTGRSRHWTLLFVLLFTAGALALGYHFGWKALAPRILNFALEDGFKGREDGYDLARPIADDYPWFGTGPGTFGTVFQLYLPAGQEEYYIQVHNDWLETRITFGWVGSALIAAAFLMVIGRWFLVGTIHGGRRFVVLIWLALAGCMLHARWDFPFQIYSILFLFLLLCAVLSILSRRPQAGAG